MKNLGRVGVLAHRSARHAQTVGEYTHPTQLTAEETRRLVSQIVTPKRRGGRPIVRRFLPYAFTENGVARAPGLKKGVK